MKATQFGRVFECMGKDLSLMANKSGKTRAATVELFYYLRALELLDRAIAPEWEWEQEVFYDNP